MDTVQCKLGKENKNGVSINLIMAHIVLCLGSFHFNLNGQGYPKNMTFCTILYKKKYFRWNDLHARSCKGLEKG